jgi:hypothetical protein
MSFFSKLTQKKTRELEIVFAGGMGTQILQAAVYFDHELQNIPVYADLSYFAKPAQIAQAGVKGALSHWPWQLDQYGLTTASFKTSTQKYSRLADGEELVGKAIAALAKPMIRQKFQVKPEEATKFFVPEITTRALCIHIRRGDYVNVASHLIADETFASIAKKFSAIANQAIILSDSPIDGELKAILGNHFPEIVFLDNIDPFSSHFIMRHAKILICSNSTFSLTAGLLNESGLVVIPKKWYGDNEKNIEKRIQEMCEFQIISI